LLDLGQRDGCLEGSERMPADLLLDDAELLALVRIPERRAHEEAVELRFGKQERSLLLDRVLGGDQKEGAREVTRDAVDRDLELRHRLEQRGLRLRHRTVD